MSSTLVPAESTPPWLELPREITSKILHKLGAIEILMTAEKVCPTWWRVCHDADMWRSIDMRSNGEVTYDLDKMCRHAVDRSRGQLTDITIENFATDGLLMYISERSNQLKSLQLISGTRVSGEGLIEAVTKLPLLEELHLCYTFVSGETIEVIGHSCPHLKSLKLNKHGYKRPRIECDLEAFAIAKSMHELRHLQLFGNKLTNEGLQAILDGCPQLEFLDLRQCFNVYLGENLGRLCSQRIKDLRCPHDPVDDYGFDAELHDYEMVVPHYDSDSDFDYGGGVSSMSSYEFYD